jgi:hypothetical protein
MNSGEIFALFWGLGSLTIFFGLTIWGLVNEHRYKQAQRSGSLHARRVYEIFSNARQEMYREAERHRRSVDS